MAKITLFIMIGLLAVTLISARTTSDNKMSCKRHGDPCYSSDECCGDMSCHIYANRCQVKITPEMLKEQRAKLKPVNRRD